MKRTRIAAAVAAAAALSLAPLASASAETPAVNDPTVEAQATFLAAAVTTESFAAQGYHSTARVSEGDLFNMKIEAWTEGFTGAAAVHTQTSGIYENSSSFSGSYPEWRSVSGGPELTAWSRISPTKSKADQRVMRKLPAGAKYVTGPAPAITPLQWSTNPWGFTASQVNQNLSNAGYLPWNLADAIAMCGDSDEMYSITCDGTVETVSGKQKVWRFTIVQEWNGESWTANVVAKSDARGIVHYAEYTAPDSTARTVLKAEISENAPLPPQPNLNKRNTIASEVLTVAAAESETAAVAKSFRTAVKSLLTQSGKKVSAKNVQWAYNQLTREGDWWIPVGSTWSSGVYMGTGPKKYEFGTQASDGITNTERFALITVKGGKMITTFSNKPADLSDTAVPMPTPRSESVDSPPVAPPWARPAR